MLSILQELMCDNMDEIAKFPLQFSAELKIIANLVPIDSSFPPRERKMSIYYDYVNKKARVDIEKGYEAAKTYIRRYDEANEYMIRPDPIDDCKRSYLGETMPFPLLDPTEFKYQGIKNINNVNCQYFLYIDYETHIHAYFIINNNGDYIPYMLIQEDVDNDTGRSETLLTYIYDHVNIGPTAVEEEELFEIPLPYSHETCENQVGGFPYIHIFHHFVRF